MRKSPENQSFVRSATFAAVLSVLSACGPNAQNEIDEEKVPPAGPVDNEPDKIAEELKAAWSAKHRERIEANARASSVKGDCTGMKISTNDAGVMEMDFSNDGPGCP
jgi:hypothetical protein